MQSVGRHNMILFPYTMPHFLSKLCRKICLATHREWAWSFCASKHSCIPWGRYVSFCVSLCTNCACLGSLQCWLGYIGKCQTNARINPHATAFSQARNNHCMQPFPRYVTIHGLQLRSKPEVISYWLFEWLTLGPVQ